MYYHGPPACQTSIRACYWGCFCLCLPRSHGEHSSHNHACALSGGISLDCPSSDSCLLYFTDVGLFHWGYWWLRLQARSRLLGQVEVHLFMRWLAGESLACSRHLTWATKFYFFKKTLLPAQKSSSDRQVSDQSAPWFFWQQASCWLHGARAHIRSRCPSGLLLSKCRCL